MLRTVARAAGKLKYSKIRNATCLPVNMACGAACCRMRSSIWSFFSKSPFKIFHKPVAILMSSDSKFSPDFDVEEERS